MSPKRNLPKRIAVLNFGGIGDEILFSPVLHALKTALPESAMTLILEKRSAGIGPLLPKMDLLKQDAIISVDLAEFSRKQLFFKLRSLLTSGKYDAVLSSGSSPFIAMMLASTGIPYRVGYASKPWAKLLLSQAAPLNTQQYASNMYFSLAESFLSGLFSADDIQQLGLPHQIQPILDAPHLEHLQWANAVLGEIRDANHHRVVLIHPGVSLMSIQKNILKGWSAANWTTFFQSLCPQHPETRFVLLGGPDDEATITAIREALQTSGNWPRNLYDWYGKTRSLEQLAALIYESDMLVSADSAPLHMAVGYHKPVVAMFGPTDEKKLIPPQGPYHAVAVKDLSCRPCLWDRRAVSCDTPVCLDVLPNDMVAAAHQQLLQL